MSFYSDMDRKDLEKELGYLNKKYQEFVNKNLKLDMSRGKPCPEQLDICSDMYKFDGTRDFFTTREGIDCRNYGNVDGITEVKQLFADLLDVNTDEVLVGGNSSLSLMHDCIVRAMLLGVYGAKSPWSSAGKVKFICPSPGYDRHFNICKLYNIEMITVGMKNDGPDMEAIEEMVKSDDSIKGIWCVPQYSNPDGITYSDHVVNRFASMQIKADDFRIFWDNAYCVHDLYEEERERVANILDACKRAGNPHRVYIFASTSKISFAGAGVALIAASKENIDFIREQVKIQTIGPNKINHLLHARFLNSPGRIDEIMKKHAAIIRPKFEIVQRIFDEELGDKNIARWTRPKGGYFISFYTPPGCAKRVVELASKSGLNLTPAGATYPYGHDPQDSNIRIAPTYPTIHELETAMRLFCLCVRIASIENLLTDNDRM